MDETQENNNQKVIPGIREFAAGVSLLLWALACVITFGNLLATLTPMGIVLAGLADLFLLVFPPAGAYLLATGMIMMRNSMKS